MHASIRSGSRRSAHEVTAIVLAAGRSSRMGSSKPLLRLRGRPLLELTLEAVSRSRVGQVVVVLGYQADQVRDEVRLARARVVVNPDFTEGLSSSIRTGVHAAGAAAAHLFVLGDEPFVSQATYEAILDAWVREGPPLVIPRYRGRRGNPVLVDRSLAAEVATLSGDTGVRALFPRHAEDLRWVEVDDPGILVDLDRPDQVRVIETGLERGRPMKDILSDLAARSSEGRR